MFHSVNAASEFVVENQTRGFQRHPEITALGTAFCVAWTDDTVEHCDVGGPDVRAKLFNLSGAPLGREFIVNTETIDHQRDPKLASIGDGRFVAIWQDFSGRGGDVCGSGLKAKLFNGSGGVLRDEFLVNVETRGRQFNASVVALKSGNFVVAWQTGADGSSRIMTRVFSANGEPASVELMVDINSHSQSDHPLIAAMQDGGFTIVWSERTIRPQGPLKTIKARQFSADGSPQGDELLINPDAAVDQTQLSAAGLLDGGFAVAWAEISNPSPFISLSLRVFDADRRPRGNIVQISSNTLDQPHSTALAALVSDKFVVVWTQRNGAGSEVAHNVHAKVFLNDGTPSEQALVIGNPARDQGNPAVVGIPDGGFAVAWEEMTGSDDHVGTSVKAQLFLPAHQ